MENKEFNFQYFKPIPDKPGYVTHDRCCTYSEFENALKEYLNSISFNDYGDELTIYDWLDYILIHEREYADLEIPKFKWIYCWLTRGSSEGFYFHIECYDVKGNTVPLMLAKTLSHDIEKALAINTKINEFIIKTLNK